MATRNWTNNGGIPISADNLNGMEADIATKMPKWQPFTTYAQNDIVVVPTGEIMRAINAFTSGATYDSTKWTAIASMASLVSRVTGTETTNTTQDATLATHGAAITTLQSASTAVPNAVEDLRETLVDMKPRPLIGARAGSGSGVPVADANYFDLLHELEHDMQADLDISNWYRAVSDQSAQQFMDTVAAELEAYPNRKILYVLEMGKSNAQFNMEMSNQIGVYPYLLETLQAIKDSGFEDRVFISPFHECNGGGGSVRLVTDGVVNNTTTITSGTAAFDAGDVGAFVTGTGIPDGTTIASVTNATTAVLSAAVVGSGTGRHLTITKNRSSGYKWQMYDISLRQLYTPFAGAAFKNGTPYGAYFRHNTVANFKEAYQRVVDMARSIGLKSKFVQWYLASNTSNSLIVDGVERMDLATGYVGDDYVDLIGLSYYNRAGDPAKSDSFGPPGANGLREFYDAFENMTRNPLWICETGCSSNPYGEKAPWYADLVKLVGSDELPRIEGMVMFLQDSTTLDEFGVPIKGADMQLDGTTQRQVVGRAITAARRGGKVTIVPEISRNLLPTVVTDMTTTVGWTSTSGVSLSISNDYTPNMDSHVNGLHVAKPAYVPGDAHAKTTFTTYRSITSAWLDYEINAPYVLSFWARASVSGFRIEAGIRQDGGFALSLGDELVLTPYWEQYIVPWAAMTADNGSWRIPNFNFGNNTHEFVTWFEVADMRVTRGTFPQPNIERLLRPRVRTLGNATNLTWNCQGAELYKVLLTGSHTLLAPTGTAHDGQEITLRVQQDGTGGRTLNLHADFFSGSINPTLATGPWSKTLLKFHYDADSDRWGLISTSVWNLT